MLLYTRHSRSVANRSIQLAKSSATFAALGIEQAAKVSSDAVLQIPRQAQYGGTAAALNSRLRCRSSLIQDPEANLAMPLGPRTTSFVKGFAFGLGLINSRLVLIPFDAREDGALCRRVSYTCGYSAGTVGVKWSKSVIPKHVRTMPVLETVGC